MLTNAGVQQEKNTAAGVSQASPLGDKDDEEDDDLQHHITAALAHVPGDTAVVPAVVLHHVDLLQQVHVVLHMQKRAILI